ncbi:MAG: hypothetical protein OXF56_13280 [Rhodobacteraceae bacterium]|nr:hypothetical protein [Paracoccaceae bacterium]
MTEKQDPVTTTDVAGAIRAMASFPWDEMLAVQRATLEELRDSKQERERLVEAFRDSGTTSEFDAGAAAGESTAIVVEALKEMKKLHDKTATYASSCSTCVNRCEQILLSVLSGIEDTRRGIGTWGLIVSVLVFLAAIDDFLYLAGRLGRMFG